MIDFICLIQLQDKEFLVSLHREDALTCTGYDDKNITTDDYDNYDITTYQYDWEGKTVLAVA